MSTESTTKKSGRTPEQQAARDARKAAKAAAAAASTAPTTTIPSNEVELPHAESSKQAIAASAPAPKSDKKRTRAERDQANDPTSTKGEAQVDEDGDLLEIDVTAPEPLSKAEARAARKRQKKGLPDLPPKLTKPDKPRRDGSPAEGEEDGQTGEGKEKKEKTKQRMNSVWIGNLSFRTTAESLKTYLEKGITEKGAVGHGAVTRVNLPKKPGKGEFAPNKGFAYVDFATPELQDIGVALSETFFEGRKLLIKKGDDHTVKSDARTPRPERAKLDPVAASILKKQIHPEGSTLFMGNLPFDATEEALRDMIEEHSAELPPPASIAAAETNEDAAQDGDATMAEGEDETEEKGKEAPKVEVVNTRGGKKSGLRKVRLGAFEDTGRCKGFAFLDFYYPQDATRTLVNRKNHFFGNRKLNLQYASESATKRAGANRNAEPSSAPKPKRYFAAPTDETTNGESTPPQAAPEYAGPPEVDEDAPKKDHRGKRWEASGRPRPGAALAMAKREKVGIVKGEGAKIVFD